MSRSLSKNTRCADRERGAAAVEFALILPILVLLVFGIVEFSIAWNHKQGLHAAAREGARVAALPQNDAATIEDRVRSALNGVMSDSAIADASITITPSTSHPCDGAAPGTHVVVTVTAPDDIEIPLYTQTVTLSGKGEFLCE